MDDNVTLGVTNTKWGYDNACTALVTKGGCSETYKYAVGKSQLQITSLGVNNSEKFTTLTRVKWFEKDALSIDNYDYSCILMRGQDPVTIAQWKAEDDGIEESSIDIKQTAAIDFLNNVTWQDGPTGFRVANTPLGAENRKATDYIDSFSAEFKGRASTDYGSEGTEYETKTSYTKPTLIENVEYDVLPDGRLSGVEFRAHANETRNYNFTNKYVIDTINVKVNVFSNYINPNGTVTSRPSGAVNAGTISFYPYVKMKYDRHSAREADVYVLGEAMRTINLYDNAQISVRSPKNSGINIESTQWSTHYSASEGLKKAFGTKADRMDATDVHSILPGGAEYSLSMNPSAFKTVVIKTWQVYLQPDSLGDKQVTATGGIKNVQTNRANLESNHNTFAQAVANKFKGIKIVQWVNRDVTKDPFKGTLVEAGGTFNSHRLSDNTKYYFDHYTESYLDVQEPQNLGFEEYEFRIDTSGNIRMNEKIILNKGQSPEYLSGAAKTINSKTGIVDALYNGVLTNAGEDIPGWYNEAFDGIKVVVGTTEFKIGLLDPNSRSSILDPKLIPKQTTTVGDSEDVNALFTNFHVSAFRTMRDDGDIVSAIFNNGKGATTKSYNITNLYESRKFFIPDMTTQDLH